MNTAGITSGAVTMRAATEAQDAGQHEDSQGEQGHRSDGGVGGDLQGMAHLTHQLAVVHHQTHVLLHRPTTPDGHQLGGVEGVDDQDGDVPRRE